MATPWEAFSVHLIVPSPQAVGSDPSGARVMPVIKLLGG